METHPEPPEGTGPPEGIGPHEGRELEMMLSGEKPLAYFSELLRAEFDWPDEKFEPHVVSGRLIKKDFEHSITIGDHTELVRSLFFALPGEEWRIQQAYDHKRRESETGIETEADAYFFGRLLGYSDEDIAAYVRWSEFVKNAKILN